MPKSIPKSVLIIGGSSQIGLAIAKECSAAGALYLKVCA